jgi:NAD-dependent DNA ligase
MNTNKNISHEQQAEKYNGYRIPDKQLKTLNGVCMGLLADNKLNNTEIDFLYQFILDCQELKNEWPYYFLLNRIGNILEDGLITEAERIDLENTLKDFLGGTLEESGATSGISTSLPLTHNPEIIFKGKSFCFTGQFAYGKRKECEMAIINKGGTVQSKVTMSLDYLVIGNLASEFWIETTYGRKIQMACEYNDHKKTNIQIISESDWERCLG